MKKMNFSIPFFLWLTAFFFTANCRNAQLTATQFRYQIIKQHLKKYARPFTSIELNAYNGQLTFHLAQKFPKSTCVMVECPNNAPSLTQQCVENSCKNIVVLQSNMPLGDIKKLGECEHFDLAIANDVYKYYLDDWQKAIDYILTLGDYIIMQTPPRGNGQRMVERYFIEKGGHCIGTPGAEIEKVIGKIYMFEVHKKYITKRRWNFDKSWTIGEYTIESDFNKKKLIKQKTRPKGYSVTEWHAGINLFTFKQLNGQYPKKEQIRELLMPMSKIEHNDLRIFNIIIQGLSLVPIDCNENGRFSNAQQLFPALINHFRSKQLTLPDYYDLWDIGIETDMLEDELTEA